MRTNTLTAAALLALAGALTLNAVAPASKRAYEPPTVSSFASCDFRAIATELVDAPRFAEGREALADSLLTAEIVSMRERVEQLEAQMQEAQNNEDAEEWQAIYAEWDRLTDELWPREGEIEEQIAERRAKDTAEAYEEVVRVARELADELGYHAIVQHDGEDLYTEPREFSEEDFEGMTSFEAMNYYQSFQQETGIDAVHARFARRPIPVLPEGVDLTDDVRYELDLD